jgi:CheY-like chemotaxis protein
MSQVLMNLCLNGIDSMEGAGKLTMRVGIDASDARHAAGAAVRVEIEDQGEGMTPDVLSQAFDPFFTTKPAGEGTGLGLSMAYGTVEDHGGRIELESTPGAGTRGIITLPRLPTPAPVQVKDEREQQASHLMGKTILVVDDDDMVRPVMAELLESLGLRTHTADGGASALAIFEATAGPIDLVLLDMNMVGMDGAETFRRLREFQSDLPVLIYSGFAQNAVVSKMLEDRRCQFLRKPFSIKTLGGAVSSLLETPG